MAQPILLVKSGGEAAMPEWQGHFAELAPGIEVRWWDDESVDPAAVRYVLVWDPEPGRLAKLPNLEVIFGSGAGVDFITADPTLPRHVPLVRMATPGAAQRMGEFVTWAVLSLMKDARRIGIAQAERRWDFFEPERIAPRTTVGIMGLGHMGRAAAGMLPATPETRHILAAPLLEQLPHGAGLVNVGRGSQQKIEDIIAALDSGRLSGAVLDVFEQEPLQADHPAWVHPKLLVTPHMASLPPRRERVEHVARLIAAHQRGEALPNTYDHERGY